MVLEQHRLFFISFFNFNNVVFHILHKQEDYYLTPDKLWIPLRWIAPELLEEFRGNLIFTDQTKISNVWYEKL